ncbi:hypothetical protein ACHHYP_07765 [Achlya hypogyna]|uniref:HAT C-terminal dimerisation domain-containing protein n=1 Tax=Achlya hypogyna TaxID=1202772 RepID=A0A1V9YQE8_ACHHY|nr:hypothetical protein ACHHYP_07765 [Achlya hypogyna]
MNVVSVLPFVTSAKSQLMDTFVTPTYAAPPTTTAVRRLVFSCLHGRDLAGDRDLHLAIVAFVRRPHGALIARFPDDPVTTVSDLYYLYPTSMVLAPSLAAFGVDSLSRLGVVYADLLPECFDLVADYPGVPPGALLAVLMSDAHAESSFPSIVVLLTICLTIAHGSVDYERAFSLQNAIKSKCRNKMSIEHLEDLMTCSRDGPSVAKFDGSEQTKTWFANKKRKIVVDV